MKLSQSVLFRVLTGTLLFTSPISFASDTDDRIENAAMDVEGVKDVKNEMTIAQTPAEKKDSSSTKMDDASITAQVRASLLSHRSTSALKTKVQTLDGVVTVGGIAKNEAEKSLVTKLVTDINGVVRVINVMTIGVPVAKE